MELLKIFWYDGVRYAEGDCWADGDGEALPAGWYYWFCVPGCLPECDPFGPFASEEEAAQDAEETFND